jgi:hypothetical protein
VQPVAGFHRPGPAADGQLGNARGEHPAEQPIEVGRCQIPVVLLEQERIARLGRIGLAGIQRDEHARGVGRGFLTTAIGTKVHLRKADPPRFAELVGMLREERLQRVLGRLGRLCDILADELHLLAQPTADDDVVALEAERQGFAIENLLLDMVLD